MTDLEEAIRVARQAVASTLKDYFDLAGRLNNLGNRLGSRYERTGDKANIEEANRVSTILGHYILPHRLLVSTRPVNALKCYSI
jgi:hypothetical protein